MKYMGIDYGEKRVGVAVSDPQGEIAFPKTTLFNNQWLWKNLGSLLAEEKISRVVVGLPLARDGVDTEQTVKVRNFVEGLQKITKIPIDFENEILTTELVKKVGIKKEHTDESAAALILQSYLDKINIRLKTKD
jgi:putative Holliday junction resolvase